MMGKLLSLSIHATRKPLKRFLPVIQSAKPDCLCTRMARPPTTIVPARNSAVPSANPKRARVPAATKIGTTRRKTGAALNTRPFQTITGFPLTADASVSRGHTPCGRSASVTIPASNPQVKNGCECATAQARRTSTHWLISPPWRLRWPPFCTALTPTVPPNRSGEALKAPSHMAFFARFSSGPGFCALFLFQMRNSGLLPFFALSI